MSAGIDKDRILAHANVTPEQFAETKLDWQVLEEIRAQHCQNIPALEAAGQYILGRLQTAPSVHSLRMRIKDADHLVAKIIRKKRDKPALEFTLNTYGDLITDLIGIRALHLFKNDWHGIHDFIIRAWDRHENPVANIRNGDPDTLIEDFQKADFKINYHPAGYRSLHYIVRFQPGKEVLLAEIQVRTIFEEGWSEIDHRFRYPAYSSDPLLGRFLAIFNGLAGTADEMGTFVNALVRRIQEHAVTLAALRSDLAAKERAVEFTIQHSTATEQEKGTLQQQFRDYIHSYISQFAAAQVPDTLFAPMAKFMTEVYASIQPADISHFLFDKLFERACTRCGKQYRGSTVTPDFGLCPACANG